MKRILWIVTAAVVLLFGAVQTAAAAQTESATDSAAITATSDTAELLSDGSGADGLLTVADRIADKEDGINLRAATTIIIVICAVLILAILAAVFCLAKRNRRP